MDDPKELEYTLYLIRSVLQDCIDKLDMPFNRESFLLYYGISAKDSEKIDRLFLDIVEQKNTVSFSDFNQMLNKKLNTDFAPQVARRLLEAYKDYQPLAISKIKE